MEGPLNVRIRGREIPVGLAAVTAVLFATAIANLLTKKVATVSGLLFTAVMFVVLVVSERIATAKKLSESKDMEKFLLEDRAAITREAVDVRPGCIVVAVRNYETLYPLEKVLRKANTRQQDIVVLTGRRMRGVRHDQGALTCEQIFMSFEQKLFSRAVAMAEREGKRINLLVVPGNDISDIIIRSALQLKASKVVAGISNRMPMEEQAPPAGEAWEVVAPQPRPDARTDRPPAEVPLLRHRPPPPRLWPVDIERLHEMWPGSRGRNSGPNCITATSWAWP